MIIKIPKIAYRNGASKWHLRSNNNTGNTVCGQRYGEDLDTLFSQPDQRISLNNIRTEDRCKKCFSAFDIGNNNES
jgi:hypothetical protein